MLEHILVAQSKFGTSIDGFTQLEQLIFQSHQLPEHTESNLKLLYKTIFEQDFSHDDFLIQRDRIKFELKTVDQHRLYKKAYGHIFGKTSGQYRGWAGDVNEIEKVTFDHVLQYRNKYLTPERTITVVAGEFNKKKILKVLSESNLLRRYKPPTSLPRSGFTKKTVWITHTDNVAYLNIFIPSCALSDFKKRSVDTILLHCLTGGNFSLLDELLYKHLAAAYSIEGHRLHWTNGGVLTISYSTPLNKGEEVADRVYEIMEHLSDHITKESVEKAKELSILRYLDTTSNPTDLSLQVGEDLLLTGQITPPNKQIEHINDCTFEEIIARAKEIQKIPTMIVRQ